MPGRVLRFSRNAFHGIHAAPLELFGQVAHRIRELSKDQCLLVRVIDPQELLQLFQLPILLGIPGSVPVKHVYESVSIGLQIVRQLFAEQRRRKSLVARLALVRVFVVDELGSTAVRDSSVYGPRRSGG